MRRRNQTYAAQTKRRRRLFVFLTVATVIAALIVAAILRHSNVTTETGQTMPTHPVHDATSVAAGDAGQHMPNPILPDSNLTPGAATTSDRNVICETGYAGSVRPNGSVWRHLRDEAYSRYHIARGHRSIVGPNGVHYPAYQIDHLIPLEIGGDPTDIRNLWPEPMGDAHRKDQVENRLHALVCGGQLDVKEAQDAIARNWTTAIPGDASR
jgi:hypothetical protein